MNKILIITYYWPPAGGPGVQRWLKFAKYLPDYTIQPIILTVDPSYASYPLFDTSLEEEVSDHIQVFRTKSVELFSFYKKLSKTKQIPYSGFASEEKVNFIQKVSRFIRGNFFIPDPRKGWNRFALKEAKKIIESEDIKYILTTGPPHSTHLIGLQLKQLYPSLNWTVDLRDPWIDIFYYDKFYPTVLSKKIDSKFERRTIEHADNVIVVSKTMKNNFAQKYHLQKEKIHVITNGFDPNDFKDISLKRNTDFTIVYTGTISDIYPMDSFIEAMSLLKDTSIKVKIVGNVHNSIADKIKEKGLGKTFEFTGRVSHKDALSYMFSADLLLLLIPQTKNSKEIVTGKIFEYLASKKAIICIGPTDGDAAEILNDTNSGKTCDFKDHLTCQKIIESFYSTHSEENHTNPINIEKFSRQNLTKQLIRTIQ